MSVDVCICMHTCESLLMCISMSLKSCAVDKLQKLQRTAYVKLKGILSQSPITNLAHGDKRISWVNCSAFAERENQI